MFICWFFVLKLVRACSRQIFNIRLIDEAFSPYRCGIAILAFKHVNKPYNKVYNNNEKKKKKKKKKKNTNNNNNNNNN